MYEITIFLYLWFFKFNTRKEAAKLSAELLSGTDPRGSAGACFAVAVWYPVLSDISLARVLSVEGPYQEALLQLKSILPTGPDELEDRCSLLPHKFSSVWGEGRCNFNRYGRGFFLNFDLCELSNSQPKNTEILALKPVILNTLFHQIFKKIICASRVDKITPRSCKFLLSCYLA